MDIATGGHTKPTLECRRQIGDDIAEHVVRDDDVKLAGIADHLHAERIHVHVFRFHLWILGGYLFENTLPKAAGMGHGIGLVTHEHTIARTTVLPVVAFAIFESETDNAFNSFAGINVFLNSHLVGGSLLKYPADVAIDALGIFADYDKIHVFWLHAFERTE